LFIQFNSRRTKKIVICTCFSNTAADFGKLKWYEPEQEADEEQSSGKHEKVETVAANAETLMGSTETNAKVAFSVIFARGIWKIV